jgi:hypothetical protein
MKSPCLLPLNQTAHKVSSILLEDVTTGEWLLTKRKGEPIEAIKKGLQRFAREPTSRIFGHMICVAHATWDMMVTAVRSNGLFHSS